MKQTDTFNPSRKKSFFHITGFPNITIIFSILVLIVVVNAITSYYYITKDRANIQKITELINPYLEDLDQLHDLVIESKMYTTNWVHIPNSIEDKARLDSIQRIKYPKLKSDILLQSQVLKNNFSDYSNLDEIRPIFNNLDTLITIQKKVMHELSSFDDYETPGKKFEAEDIIESELFPQTQLTLGKLQQLTNNIRKESRELKLAILRDSERITNILLFLSFCFVVFILVSIYFMGVNIRKPSEEMKNIIDKLSKGELYDKHIEESNNTIGDMALSLNKLIENFKKTALFATEIEHGNLSAPFEKLSENDHLGEALISMRDSLLSYSVEMESKIKQRTEEAVQKGKDFESQKIFYETVLSSMPLDIFIYDQNKKFVYINDVAIKDKEIRNKLIGKSDIDYCYENHINPDFALRIEQSYNQARDTNTTAEFEDKITDENQKTVWKIRRFTPVFESNHFRYMIAYGMDITGMKHQEIQIKESLEEKESLLGEIHHRVKNNLTLVLGLIEMQRDMQTDGAYKNQFNEIKNRIYAMALIHDKMYRSNSFAKIDLDDYLKDLITTVSKFYGKGKMVNLKFDLEKVFVIGRDAIPIALLVNEIVTNSFKYAFDSLQLNQRDAGMIMVSLHQESDNEKQIVLTIKDNGRGLPEGFDITKTKSLGFKLIHIFVKQLKGDLKYFNDHGLNFVIKFKL